MHEIVFGLLGLAVTLLGSLVLMVWRFAALATTLSVTIAELKKELGELKRGLEAIGELPVLKRQVTQLEEMVKKLASIFPKYDSRIAVLETKALSTADKFRAISKSRPDPEET